MADYIKPIINHQRNQAAKTKEKLECKVEEKVLVGSEGMGDFDYEKYQFSPIVHPQQDEERVQHEDINIQSQIKTPALSKTESDVNEYYDKISYQTKKIMQTIDNELAENYENHKVLETELNKLEMELEKRQKLYDTCSSLFNEDMIQMEKHCEKMRKFDDTLSHHQEVLDSWQCLINDFRKIPTECE